MVTEQLYWHCLHCGANDPVEPTGDVGPTGEAVSYVLGDHEPCITCGDGTAHVVTIRLGAAYEQGLALGLGIKGAWARAQAQSRTERKETKPDA